MVICGRLFLSCFPPAARREEFRPPSVFLAGNELAPPFPPLIRFFPFPLLYSFRVLKVGLSFLRKADCYKAIFFQLPPPRALSTEREFHFLPFKSKFLPPQRWGYVFSPMAPSISAAVDPPGKMLLPSSSLVGSTTLLPPFRNFFFRCPHVYPFARAFLSSAHSSRRSVSPLIVPFSEDPNWHLNPTSFHRRSPPELSSCPFV